MNEIERAEHKRELGRERSRRHYASHKDEVKSRVKGEYHQHKQDILKLIRARLQPQIEQAISGSQYVVLNERKSKYRQCGLCFHYSYLKHTELISPFGNIISRTFCPYCGKKSESVIYELS